MLGYTDDDKIDADDHSVSSGRIREPTMSEQLTKAQLRTLEVVRFFRENPGQWTKGAKAKNRDGILCWPTDPDAATFCFAGVWIKLGFDAKEFPRSFDPLVHNDLACDLDDMLRHAQRAVGLPAAMSENFLQVCRGARTEETRYDRASPSSASKPTS